MFDQFFKRLTSAIGRDPLVPLALAAGVGILVADHWAGRVAPVFYLAVALSALAVGWRRPRWPGLFVVATAGIFAFSHGVTLWSAGQFVFSPNLRNGETIRLEARGLVIREPDAPGAGRSRSGRCVVRFTEMKVAGLTFPCDQRLPVRLTSPNEMLRYGDVFVTTGRLKPFDPPRNPGAFDAAAFFSRTLGAEGEFAVGSGDRIRILERGAGNPVIAASLTARRVLERYLSRGLEEEPERVAVIKAMALGSREDTPEHIEEQFRLSGAMHVFAVSGLHVGLFLTLLWGLLRWLGVPRRHAVLLLVPAVLFYAVVTGLRPSAVRAAVMGTVVLLGFVAERRPRLLNSLGFAALLLLAFDTQQLFLPGFQLSFAVLASIALFADVLHGGFYRPWRIDPFLPRRFVPRWRRGVDSSARWLSQALAVSLVAWLGSAWLVAHHFQLLTPVAVPANVVMVPAAFAVLGIAFSSLLLSLIGLGGYAGALLNPLNGNLVGWLGVVAGAFAAVPGGHLHLNPAQIRSATPPPGVCRITVSEPNFGGLSQLWSFRLPDGRPAHWLVDPGDPIGYASAGQPLLRHWAVNRLQALVLTHGDVDHLGAGPLLVDRYRPGAVISSPHDGRSSAVPRLLESVEHTGVRHLRVGRGDRIPLSGEETTLTMLYPPRDGDPPGNADDRCLVWQLRHHDWKILSTADSGFPTEKWLLAAEERGLPAEVWIKGWHGTEVSGLIEFLDRVRPVAVVTTHHDFPTRQGFTNAWRNELESRGIVLFNLTEIGAVEIELSPETLRVVPATPGRGQPLVVTRQDRP